MVTAVQQGLRHLYRMRRSARRMRRGFWQPPERLLLTEGASGELTMARIRFLVVGLIVLAVVFELRRNPAPGMLGWGLGVALGSVALAIAAYVLVHRHPEWAKAGFYTSVLDVTLITAVLVVFLIADRPHAAVNSRVLFSAYLIVIFGTSLRFDQRICVLTGLFAIAQYSGIVAFAALRWDLNSEAFLPFYNGTFDLNIHYARLILLWGALLVSTINVDRAQTLRGMSARDPLTGLMARGFFDERVGAEASRALRYNRELSVAMIDIDYFKRFNDNYGHAVGDEVLRVIGKLLRSVRQSDLVARYGGEEFIIVFPETPPAAAVMKAEQLRALIEQSSLTVSIGIAGFPADADDIWMVVAKADERMYEAKKSGRNQVIGPPKPAVAAA
jgi:diguanylate cyclase (GGDEF)-like protein